MEKFVKILFIVCVSAFMLLPTIMSFKTDCQHIYTAVEQKEVKIKYPPSMKLSIFPPQKTGKHEGQDLVCIKCFHLTKQILDFGPHTEWPAIIDSTGQKVKADLKQ